MSTHGEERLPTLRHVVYTYTVTWFVVYVADCHLAAGERGSKRTRGEGGVDFAAAV